MDKEIHDKMVKTLGEDSPSCYSTVKKWVADIRRHMVSTENDARTVHPQSVTTDVQVDDIHRMVMNDRHVTVKHISWGISCASVPGRFILL